MPASIRHTLSQIEARFGAVQVVSAYRQGATVRGTGRRSLHADCRAVDFNPPRGRYSAVVAWLRGHHSGGLGTYSGRFHHIHIDNGGKFAWHDGASGHSRVAWAGSGQQPRRAVYGGRITRVASYIKRSRVASYRRHGSRHATRHVSRRYLAEARRHGGRYAAAHHYRAATVRRGSKRVASMRGYRVAHRRDGASRYR